MGALERVFKLGDAGLCLRQILVRRRRRLSLRVAECAFQLDKAGLCLRQILGWGVT
jgi:hypothetical protein